MFPLSGRLVAASKSNSSTLEPSRITTRVSSWWLASMSMRLVMEISGARAHWAAKSGGRKEAARIVCGKNRRKHIRRNGHGDRESVGRQRKSDSHGTRAAARTAFGSEPGNAPLSAFVAERVARIRGGAGHPRESRRPAGAVFVGCRRGFNKRLMAKGRPRRAKCYDLS